MTHIAIEEKRCLAYSKKLLECLNRKIVTLLKIVFGKSRLQKLKPRYDVKYSLVVSSVCSVDGYQVFLDTHVFKAESSLNF